MSKQTINNGDSGLVVRTAINENFTELYNGRGIIPYVDGISDWFATIQAVLDSTDIVTLGSSPDEIFTISQPLILNDNQRFIINGTIKIKDGVTSILTADANIGDTRIYIADVSGFNVGEYVVMTDDLNSITSGGRTTYVGDSRPISAIGVDYLDFVTPFLFAYAVSENAYVTHHQSCIIAYGVDNIRISGHGIIDNNQDNQSYVGPLQPYDGSYIESAIAGMCISLMEVNESEISGLELKNGSLHNLGIFDCTQLKIFSLVIKNAHDKNIVCRHVEWTNFNDIFIDGSVEEDGITLYSSNYHINISDILVKNCPRGGIIVNPYNHAVNITNCNFLDNGSAILIGAADYVTCSNINVYDSDGIAIRINGGTNIFINNIVTKGSADSSDYVIGIISDAENVSIINGVVENTKLTSDDGVGIELGGSGGEFPTNVLISNVFLKDLKVAQEVHASCSEIHFVNCFFIDNTNNGSTDNATYTNCIGLS